MVEVVKGPQGTLFGRNASAGAFSITSAKPDADGGGSLDIGVGEDGYGEEEMGEEDYDDNRYNMQGRDMGDAEYDDEGEGDESMMES